MTQTNGSKREFLNPWLKRKAISPFYPGIVMQTVPPRAWSDHPDRQASEHKPHVLVVDDDPIVLEVIRDRLESAGYDVSTRSEELGTSAWIAVNKPDIVLLDVMMPALRGNEIASLVLRRGVGDGVGIIFHSSKSPDELEELVQRSGALGAICKTGDERSFLRQFKSLAARHRRS